MIYKKFGQMIHHTVAKKSEMAQNHDLTHINELHATDMSAFRIFDSYFLR